MSTPVGKEEQLKVIGAGFGRTATESLQKALIILGYPCYHMHEMHDHPEDNDVFVENLKKAKNERDWNKTLFAPRGYIATVDWPTTAIYEELFEANPSAKVILTVRDSPEQWYKSAANSIYKLSQARNWWQMKLLTLFNRQSYNHKIVVDFLWNTHFNGKFHDKQFAINVYNQHIERCKKVIPSEQLLIFNVKQGWKPLCDFLDKEIPNNTPFPRGNTTADKQKIYQRLIKFRRNTNIAAVVFVIVVFGTLYKYYKSK